MTNWREEILAKFVPGVSRKTVVADPDELFRDDGIFRGICKLGFSLIYFEDRISFRFIYESDFRDAWDKGEDKELVVVFKTDTLEFEKLPADLLKDARKLSFYLKDIFPNLSYGVVSKLERIYFDTLFQAHNHYATQPLGETLTQEFILKHIFETVPEVIKKDSDLLRTLLKRHYHKINFPDLLDKYLLSVIAKTGKFDNWPLNTILSDRSSFFEFLQERWGLFITSLKGGGKKGAVADPAALKYPGVRDIPFDHDDIRAYIDNLFEEGSLQPIEWDSDAIIPKPWVKVGLKGHEQKRIDLNFEDLCRSLEEKTPGGGASAQEWLLFAPKYAQLKYLWYENIQELKAPFGERYQILLDEINSLFESWILENYQGLYNYPSATPVMVHHIPGYIAHRLIRSPTEKGALLLVDGLSLDQWLLLKDTLLKYTSRINIRENALMAWIPTITPVSRQAVFSGKIPAHFADTVYRTDKDEYLWRQFWSDRGLEPDEISFLTLQGNAGDELKLENVLNYQTRVFGS